MSSIVVCGGSVVGLSTAMLLAADGHDVTVLEGDAATPPDRATDAWDGWDRRGVPQFHQPHNLFPRYRLIADQELPFVSGELEAAGCLWLDPISFMPPFIEDRNPRPGDERFRFLTGRRPVLEAALTRAAGRLERLEIRRGVRVGALATDRSSLSGVPHVSGVVTDQGESLAADLVVDATGRRSKLSEWLGAIGARQPEVVSEDSGFVYHTRYFRGSELPAVIAPLVVELGSISVLTLPSDNGTWSVTLFAAAGDQPLKGMRDVDRFTAVARACPLQAHWLNGEPTTDVLSMAGVLDRYRRFVIDGEPVATGVVAVGDAWACTNPSAGRGMSVGMVQAQQLRDVVRAHLDDPTELALRYFDATEEKVAPFFRHQIKADRFRLAEIEAICAGTERPEPDPFVRMVAAGSMRHPDVFRAMLELRTCLALPEEVMARPGFLELLGTFADAPVMTPPGPDRRQLLELVA
jgi:2-polyprenyl-6-methoxyphenol hydroxylase-like FAD-dependent oxidoreductase